MNLEILHFILILAYLCVGGVILTRMEVLQGIWELADNPLIGAGLVFLCGVFWPLLLVLHYFAATPQWFGPPRSREGTVKDDLEAPPAVGSQGVAKSDLKPWGKATFGTRDFEVHANGFLNAGTPVVVEQIRRKLIEVRQLP